MMPVLFCGFNLTGRPPRTRVYLKTQPLNNLLSQVIVLKAMKIYSNLAGLLVLAAYQLNAYQSSSNGSQKNVHSSELS